MRSTFAYSPFHHCYSPPLAPQGHQNPPTDDPGLPGHPRKPGISIEQAATNLGVTLMAGDEHGVPRLIRAIDSTRSDSTRTVAR
jgi:hypothetical protein